ncbi:hypothetical protein HYPSUDRAFT_89462 [Hypholoma sublateritium FD-334 SS-4]|uniref:Nephrocystin 3-like N-terminal domain-containing protein n=1 Tax=Hypholoma sublateritium (strain FD-334 SS-4) TaxID=945553 RepID=A0A0D2KXN8_HYPSF|nr:hypothetical protein HYPSUDRAFT_89462 [Hypholoma sublateritium FD-334 SS-4]
MSFFNNARDVVINGGSFNAFVQSGMDRLVKAANPNAMHDSSARYDPPKCHPGTREAILEHIMGWVFGSDDKDALILWLYGPAGAGKSAIMQSIAEKCVAFNILLSSFFFSRSDGTRNHPGSLVATIAYQISTIIPHMANNLSAAVARDPMIFNKTLDVQIELLIVEPLADLVQSGFFANPKSSPRLILIDGLDECSNEGDRRAILLAIVRVIDVHKFPFIFLISSRPETDIKFSFDSPELAGLWDSLVLDDSHEADCDIQFFLQKSFQSIRATHPMRKYIPEIWPTQPVGTILIRKSSGQFIYASTVIKYISSLHVSPPRQLDIIMGVLPARSGNLPFAEIDALYMHILSSIEDTQLMLDVLAILIGYFDLTGARWPVDISAFLGVDPEDIDIVLAALASITVATGNDRVYISHASLSDFLADRRRSGRFHLDIKACSSRLARKGIKWLSTSAERNSTLDLPDIFTQVFLSLKMSEDLYQYLESLPLELIWRQSRLKDVNLGGVWRCILPMFDFLLPKNKLALADTTPQINSWSQSIAIKYAKLLKPFIRSDFNLNIRVKHFPALMETLVHDFVLDGTQYGEALTGMLQDLSPSPVKQYPENCLPSTVFKTIGLTAVNAGENPYIHTALQIFKSLTTFSNPYWPRLHDGHESNRRMRWLGWEDQKRYSKFLKQRKRYYINSGKIYRLRRQLRLRKLRPGINHAVFECYCTYSWNHSLVAFLVPILDHCPRSDKLLGLINHRVRRVFLKYTPRRCLRDAVYSYIRRASDVGSN